MQSIKQTRRTFLKSLSLCAASCFLPSGPLFSSDSKRKPNILFILADDMGWMDSTVYGSQYYETPNFERLTKRGMLFTDAYAASPLCSPTRASILSGQYPARLGITTPACHLAPLPAGTPLLAKKSAAWQKVICPQSRRFLPLENYTIAEALKDAGYTTGFIGKWHLGQQSKYWPAAQGFEFDLGAPNPGPPSYFSPYKFKTIKDGPKGEYITDRVTDEAIRYLEKDHSKPFFLCLWHFAVHAPFQAKQKFIEKYRGKVDPRGKQDCPTMAGMMQSLDESIGRVLDKLDELDLSKDTIIIFVSDNGGNMYDRVEGKPPTNNAPLRGGKGTIYEGGTKVPCVVVWPGIVETCTKCSEIISTVDFYPTLLEMASVATPQNVQMDGESIMPLLKNSGKLKREAVFCHFPHYVPATANFPSTSVRKDDFKLIRFYGEGINRSNAYELYNLRDDIGETTNLALLMPDKVAELDVLIDRFIKETDAVVPVINPAYNAQAKPPRWGSK